MNQISTVAGLPVLDLSRFGSEESGQARFLADLRTAAREVGFFYVIGHGVPEALNAAVLDQARALFALPEEQKLAIEMVNSPHFRGYNRAGFEYTRGKPDWREQIDIGAEEAPVPPGEGPAYLRLKGPNQWPAALPDFEPVVLDWQERVTEVLVRLLRAFALALDQSPDAFAPIYDGSPHKLLKLIRYPGRTAEDAEQGVGAHKDSGLLSLILQDGHGGLQVEAADGRWIDAAPRAGAFVVNIGELLELAADGYLKATVHRVISPPPGAERYSAAFFLGARLDATVPALQLPHHLAAEAPGFARDPQNPLFHQVGQNTLKSRLRSHPDVAARHHADLLTQSS
jgi:isopenicillin N synthase-like dioxygenase